MSEELSYVTTPRKFPLLYKTIIDALQEDVSGTPDRECMIYRGTDGSRESLTYKELHTQATKLAKVLLSKGINKGDNIALLGPNTLEVAVAEIGIILAGGVIYHLNASIIDTQKVLEESKSTACRLILIDPGKDQTGAAYIIQFLDLCDQSQTANASYANGIPLLFLRTCKNIPHGADVTKLCDENVEVNLPKLYPEEDVIIFTTSGSTGKAKLVPHSHFSIVNLARFDPKIRSQEMKTYNDRPFQWFSGCPSIYIGTHYARVFTDSSIAAVSGHSTLNIWNIIKEENCKHATLMPYFLFDLIQIKNEYDEQFMLDAISTGGQIIDSLYKQVIGIFTRALVLTYGMTEVLFISTEHCLMKDDPFPTGAAGTPIGGVEVKVVDEKGNVTERCQQGEICIRSPMMFKGYYNDDENASFLPGNWFRSGDIGHVKKDGRIVIQGRIKDVICRGVNKIIPSAQENVIMNLKGLSSVVVVPVPDKRMYEEVCVCFTVIKDSSITEADVKAYCEEQFLTENYADGIGERPKYYLKFESFPRLFSGKMNRTKIRSNAVKCLDLDY